MVTMFLASSSLYAMILACSVTTLSQFIHAVTEQVIFKVIHVFIILYCDYSTFQ